MPTPEVPEEPDVPLADVPDVPDEPAVPDDEVPLEDIPGKKQSFAGNPGDIDISGPLMCFTPNE